MSIQLEVWGDYALFTRPEMKVERVSYDIMTPSAARGLVEAIYWHPGLKWIIDRIHVCAPIRFTNLRRNEVKSTLSARSARTVMERGKGELYLCTSDDIQQRAALLLRDVRYVIEAHFDMTSQAAPGDNPGKFTTSPASAAVSSPPISAGARSCPPARRSCWESATWAGSCTIWTIQIRRISAPCSSAAPCGTGCWRYPPGKVGRCGDDFAGTDRVLSIAGSGGENCRAWVEIVRYFLCPLYQ